MLNLPRLRLLRELHRRGSLVQVADALSYTPSAVSQQLAVLEREVGVQLLERVGRGVRLTDQAVALAEHADVVISRLEVAESELAASRDEVRGVLRVASFQTVVLAIAPFALSRLAEQHPELQIEISQQEADDAYSGLLAHDFDVILGEEYPGRVESATPGTHREVLFRDPMLLATPLQGPWADVSTDLADLAEVPWALEPPYTLQGEWSRRTIAAAGFVPRVSFESPDPLLQAHLVRSGHAVAIVPRLIPAPYLDEVRLTELPAPAYRTLHTAVREGRAAHPAIVAFRAALAEAAARAS